MTAPAPDYRTILVPLDGSDLSERALPYATAVAQAAGARLVLLQVAIANLVTRNDPLTGQPETVDLAAAYLGDVRARIGEGVTAETIEFWGEPGPEIVRAARERGAGLIAMATHGRSGLGRWLYGSVADHVLRHAEVPVLLVSAVCPPAWPEGGPGTILVPLDGSALAEAALAPAAALAGPLRARLLLLRAVEPPVVAGAAYATGYVYADYDPGPALEEARGYLEGVARGLRERGLTADVAAEEGPAAAAIARAARERGAGLIAMATHGRSGIGRLVLGSVATGVLHQAAAPLLLLRPGPGRPAPDGGG
jgi:nucleotide-binding universal stress UspA family protein